MQSRDLFFLQLTEALQECFDEAFDMDPEDISVLISEGKIRLSEIVETFKQVVWKRFPLIKD